MVEGQDTCGWGWNFLLFFLIIFLLELIEKMKNFNFVISKNQKVNSQTKNGDFLALSGQLWPGSDFK